MATHQEDRAGANLSYWEATAKEAELRPLRENAGCDVCIVGAGIATQSTGAQTRVLSFTLVKN